jgi:hypothetical protein
MSHGKAFLSATTTMAGMTPVAMSLRAMTLPRAYLLLACLAASPALAQVSTSIAASL